MQRSANRSTDSIGSRAALVDAPHDFTKLSFVCPNSSDDIATRNCLGWVFAWFVVSVLQWWCLLGRCRISRWFIAIEIDPLFNRLNDSSECCCIYSVYHLSHGICSFFRVLFVFSVSKSLLVPVVPGRAFARLGWLGSSLVLRRKQESGYASIGFRD